MAPKNSPPPVHPLGDPKAYRGYSTKLKQLAASEKRTDFLPPLERSIGSFTLELAKIVILAFVIIVPIRMFVLQPFYVRGASMEPTYYDNEYLIIDEISYRLHEPRRGDVIVLRNPNLQTEYLIKRVIGLPGERVVVTNGKVSVFDVTTGRGGVLNESIYLPKGRTTFGTIDVTLGKDEYYVMGDNRQFSLDSRSFGPVLRREIIGRSALRAWPISRLEVFSTPDVSVTQATTP